MAPITEPLLCEWFAPQFVSRFAKVGLQTVEDLAAFIESRGANWFREVERIGPGRAALVIAWLKHNSFSGRYMLRFAPTNPWTQLRQSAENRIAPLEHFVPPDFAAQGHHQLVHHLDQMKRTGLHSTFLAYRREAERFHLFCCIELSISILDATSRHLALYGDFLCALGWASADPWPYRTRLDEWVGPRHCERSSNGWRPFAGPLRLSSRARALDGTRAVLNRLGGKIQS